MHGPVVFVPLLSMVVKVVWCIGDQSGRGLFYLVNCSASYRTHRFTCRVVSTHSGGKLTGVFVIFFDLTLEIGQGLFLPALFHNRCNISNILNNYVCESAGTVVLCKDGRLRTASLDSNPGFKKKK
jgi:hypothetical protein